MGPRARDRLGAREWTRAGLALLGRGGVDAVRVEPLAAALGVTKGSFYWHFADRGALLDAVLAEWERRATADVIAWVEAGARRPADRLSRLFTLVARSRRAPGVEQAVRAWGARDPRARRVLARVDARRAAYVRDLLVAHGLAPAAARRRAHFLFLALVGEFTWVSHGGAPTGPGPWRELVRLVLAG